MFKKIAVISFCILFIGSCSRQYHISKYEIIKTAYAEKGMVVSAHPLASEVGLEVLKKGGNAIDAAIAVQFALAVTYPVAGNIGGGGFMVIRLANGDLDCIDFRETGPGKAYKDMYLDKNGSVIPSLSVNGHLAAGVPGSVSGMFAAFEKYSLIKNMNTILNPSIEIAKHGFKITERQADGLNSTKKSFIKYNTSLPAFVKEERWKSGDLLVQEDLAKTLERIKEQGSKGFYEGETADLIVAEMSAGGGIISHEDLKNYKAKWKTPIRFPYNGHEVISMPPASSGGVAIKQLLKMVEPYELSTLGFHSKAAVHLMVEAEKRVYADRSKHLGDDDFYPVPLEKMTSNEYLVSQMENFNPDKATPSEEISSGDFDTQESEQTTHFSVVDQFGNAVSVTTTINTGYGSKTVVSGAGFLLNNEMDDFSAKPGVPNVYGLLGAEANSIQPGKRMLSSMTPSIVTKDGKLLMVVGTPGGSTIITSVFQTIVNVVDFGMTMTEAVSAPRFHHQWKPDLVYVEDDAISEKVRIELKSLGHRLTERGKIGRVDAILVSPDGKLEGAADPRGDDHAVGWKN